MNICVFCSSSDNISAIYKDTTYQLGKQLALAKHDLVFGNGHYGLMGIIAKGFKENGGKVIGVIPEILNKEHIVFKDCDEAIVTTDLTERKIVMEQKADAFIILAGGIGTFDEFYDVLGKKYLNYHQKPIIIYNVNNYYDKLIEFMEDSVKQGFMNESRLQIYKVCNSIQEIIAYLGEDKK